MESRLPQEEELRLFESWRSRGSEKCKDRLFAANTGLVYKLSELYSSPKVDKEDLIQSGMEGLVQALNAFKVEMGVPFGTYAAQWIKQGMRKFLMDSDGTVRIATSKSLRKLYFKLPKHLPIHRRMTDLEAVDVAKKLNTSVADVREMEDRKRSSYIMIQSTDNQDANEDEGVSEVQVPDTRVGPEGQTVMSVTAKERRLRMERCLDGLSDRQKLIIKRRYLVDHADKVVTQKDLASEMGISYQAIQQNEKKALKMLENNIKSIGGSEVWL